MSNKEKLPKLVDVYRSSIPLKRRQLPLVVDENLSLVMDVKGSGIVCDNPLVRGKELEEFTRKWEILSEKELNDSLQITKSELMNVLNQNVPCVGCRRSVERLHHQLFKLSHPTLDPLIVQTDGTITIRSEQQAMPQILCSIFHNHSARLAKLIENQPKRNKKSLRCLLHSLDSQRSRPLTPVWRDLWDCMRPECKKDICIIEAPTLYVTLETYLRKHRFCGECRTKVLKAYTLLMEDPEPCKEKGYVSALYAGITRCVSEKHIHLQMKTDYIIKLIGRAEPELLGRERHAKTLEIAQEEVLTCLGICMYERLHRIYMRVREEECTCQVFAAVAVDCLSRSFETAVERKQGVSQLELLYAELAREEQQKLIRKEAKKIKRRRKKGKLVEEEEAKEFEDEFDVKEACYGCELGKEAAEEDEEEEVEEYWCKCEGEEEREGGCKYGGFLGGGCGGGGLSRLKGKSEADCGYSSENNNGCCETGSVISSISSSPEGSELACSDHCCHEESKGRYGHHRSLQEMLEPYSDEDDENDWMLTPEEVYEFENNHTHLVEKRQELREALMKKFIDFCAYGPLQVPRLLVQTKYASN